MTDPLHSLNRMLVARNTLAKATAKNQPPPEEEIKGVKTLLDLLWKDELPEEVALYLSNARGSLANREFKAAHGKLSHAAERFKALTGLGVQVQV